MLSTNIPNPPTKPKRALSPRTRDALAVLKAGGSCKCHNGKAQLFDHHGARHRWFAAVHLKQLHTFGLVTPACYVAHAPTEWTLTTLGRLA
jgi:hypothetical protein